MRTAPHAQHAAQAVCTGYAPWEYLGYGRRQYARIRELEPLLARTISGDLDRRRGQADP